MSIEQLFQPLSLGALLSELEKGGPHPGKGRQKNPDNVRLRDMEHPTVLGYELDRQTLTPILHPLPALVEGKDNGSDPIWEGDEFKGWRMVPSGDIVTDPKERDRRLGKE